MTLSLAYVTFGLSMALIVLLALAGCTQQIDITTPGCATSATATAGGGGGGAGDPAGGGGAGAPGNASATGTTDCSPGTVSQQ